MTIIGATKIPELTAGVVFYGIPPEQAAKPADVKIPLQGHFANKDDWCTPALVDGFEKAMKAAGKSLELFRYDAEHAFVNEQRLSVHDRQCAELAWGRATEFFKKHLGEFIRPPPSLRPGATALHAFCLVRGCDSDDAIPSPLAANTGSRSLRSQ